ncbi:MAG: DUF3108 domain-containing protein [Burkholderiaceae bacterium]|nr:DUF3108 domain-containing protein [Burkholderiaceae bacterium]
MFVRNSSSKTKPALRRVMIILIAVVLLHALAIDWAGDKFQALQMQDREPPPIAEVQLAPPAPPTPEAAPTHKPFKPKAKPKPQQRIAPPDAAPALAAITAPPPDPIPELSGTPATDPVDTALPSLQAPGHEVAAESNNPADKPEEDKSAPVHYKVELPPSAELKYDLEQVRANGGNPSYGSSKISWQNLGDKYQVTGEASVLFISLFKFTSEGVFDSYGIAPVTYSEKRIRRSETATHFNRDERNNISFSASSLSYPIKGGEQDTSSVVWELAGIGRGDREKFIPGAQIDLFVAGTRDADIWSILVVGQEEIDIDHAKMQTWHVTRFPRAGSYERKIDIWLAPQDQWYPVKIRQTEKSGDYYEMTMTSVRALPDQAAR